MHLFGATDKINMSRKKCSQSLSKRFWRSWKRCCSHYIASASVFPSCRKRNRFQEFMNHARCMPVLTDPWRSCQLISPVGHRTTVEYREAHWASSPSRRLLVPPLGVGDEHNGEKVGGMKHERVQMCTLGTGHRRNGWMSFSHLSCLLGPIRKACGAVAQ